MRERTLISLAAFALFSACAAGPDYQAPQAKAEPITTSATTQMPQG